MRQIVVKRDETCVLPLLWVGTDTNKMDGDTGDTSPRAFVAGVDENIEVILAEPGASVRLTGLALGDNDHGFDLRVRVYHRAPQTKSEVIIKTALTDSARLNINGLTVIEPGAKESQAWMAMHLLLLSASAKGQATPSLEILENDVRAGHAATVGRLSETELFYLMSRGLSRQQSKYLMISGFLEAAISQFPHEQAAVINRIVQGWKI